MILHIRASQCAGPPEDKNHSRDKPSRLLYNPTDNGHLTASRRIGVAQTI